MTKYFEMCEGIDNGLTTRKCSGGETIKLQRLLVRSSYILYLYCSSVGVKINYRLNQTSGRGGGEGEGRWGGERGGVCSLANYIVSHEVK